MAIVSIGPLPGYPKSSESLEGKRVTVSHTHKYQIVVDDENDYGDALFALLPDYTRVGWAFGGGNCLIRSRSLDREAGARLKWILTINADDKFDEETKQDMAKPPDQRKPDWSWDFETIQRALTVDRQGQAIENTAGDPFDVERDIALPILTITRHQAQFDPDTIASYVNHVNKTTFWGVDAGAVLCTGIRDRKDSEEVYAGISYRLVTYIFKFAVPVIADVLEGHTLILVNNGPNQLVAGERVGIKDKYGVSIRANLSVFGAALAQGVAPILRRFEQFPEAEFNDLNLGPF